MRSERKVLYIDNLPEALDLTVSEDETLALSIACFDKLENAKISVKVHRNGFFEGFMADFATLKGKIDLDVELLEEGAECNWHLSSMSTGDSRKEFNTSVKHMAAHTNATMSNYGIARDESKITFKGVSTIEKGSIKTTTKQIAKIIVFDPNSDGIASPSLVINDNDTNASHAAVVGRLNEQHLYYLQSRGISLNEAKRLIALGYLKPIEAGFADDNLKNQIDCAIEGAF